MPRQLLACLWRRESLRHQTEGARGSRLRLSPMRPGPKTRRRRLRIRPGLTLLPSLGVLTTARLASASLAAAASRATAFAPSRCPSRSWASLGPKSSSRMGLDPVRDDFHHQTLAADETMVVVGLTRVTVGRGAAIDLDEFSRWRG